MVIRILVVWLLLCSPLFADRASWAKKQADRRAARVAKRLYRPVDPWQVLEAEVYQYSRQTQAMTPNLTYRQRERLLIGSSGFYYDGWYGFHWGLVIPW